MLCDTFGKVEWDPRCRSRFLSDGEFGYDPPPGVDVKMHAKEEPTLPKREPERDNTEDFLVYITYLTK
jgi:hypothetical protein